VSAHAADEGFAGVRPGDVLAGKYRIERLLGVGGMGVVVSAMHLELEERVAIKLLLARALEDAEVVERFAREARAAVKIKSEHVAHVLDVGKLPNGAPFMVMEHLDGADVAAVIRSRGALSVAETAEYVLQACEAIAEAHALGIVHRDLKPANLFLTRRPDGLDAVKVLDFGISKMPAGSATRSGMGLTSKLSSMGSPLYMSPEQMSSARDVDLRTDIWALGVILYECATGLPPFEAETIPQLCAQILQESPPPMSDMRPDVPAKFEQVVLRCLHKKRSRRYPNVGELAVDLIPFAHKRARRSAERIARIVESTGSVRIEVPPSLPPAEDGVREDSPTTIMPGPLYRLARRRMPLVLGLALVSAAALGLGVWWLMPKTAPESQIAQRQAQVVAPDSALAPTAVAASVPSANVLQPASTPLAPPSAAAPARAPAAKRTQAAPALRSTAAGNPHHVPRSQAASKKAASSADEDIWGSRR
jgi:serine/threonine-protein kinase